MLHIVLDPCPQHYYTSTFRPIFFLTKINGKQGTEYKLNGSDWERKYLNLKFRGHCGHETQPLQ